MIFAGESPKTGFVREEGFEFIPERLIGRDTGVW
jgi:hypothetical protein